MNNEREEILNKMTGNLSECLFLNGIKGITFNKSDSFEIPEKLTPFNLELILSELTDNCLAQGAKEITITLGDRKIRVEDDVEHCHADVLVERLNQIKRSETRNDSEKWKTKRYEEGKGVGISEIVLGVLDKIQGSLKYSVSCGGRITAEITWE